MAWSSEDDSTAGPTGPTADPTPTAAPKTATSPRPKAASLSGVFMATRSAGATASAAGHLVPGLLHGGADGALVDRRLAGHGQPAAGEVDVDAGDAGHLGDLLGHRADAVAAGHADDGVGGGAHGRSLRGDSGGSGTDEPGDGLRGLAHLLLGLAAAGGRRLDEAVAHVLLEQTQRDRLECLRHRRHLGEDVDAVLLVLDHALQTAGLTLDAAEPLQVVVLAVDVAVLVLVLDGLHGDPSGRPLDWRRDRNYTPLGFICRAGRGRWRGGGRRPSGAGPRRSAAARRPRGRRRARPGGRRWPPPRRGSARRREDRACVRRE